MDLKLGCDEIVSEVLSLTIVMSMSCKSIISHNIFLQLSKLLGEQELKGLKWPRMRPIQLTPGPFCAHHCFSALESAPTLVRGSWHFSKSGTRHQRHPSAFTVAPTPRYTHHTSFGWHQHNQSAKWIACPGSRIARTWGRCFTSPKLPKKLAVHSFQPDNMILKKNIVESLLSI